MIRGMGIEVVHTHFIEAAKTPFIQLVARCAEGSFGNFTYGVIACVYLAVCQSEGFLWKGILPGSPLDLWEKSSNPRCKALLEVMINNINLFIVRTLARENAPFAMPIRRILRRSP